MVLGATRILEVENRGLHHPQIHGSLLSKVAMKSPALKRCVAALLSAS
jgi:hypothetical protein